MTATSPATSDAPPRQFSDLAVSPYGNPASLLTGEVRVAFAGRTSTEDKQDPRQSLIRQLDKSKFALPEAWVIVAHYYDVESGRKEIAERGHGADVSRFDIPIPRDGGIDDLLMEASRPDRRFDVVICENMSRLARQMYGSLTVERQLEQAGMALFASNEPIQLTTGRAQQILQRRINQSVAEYEALNILETSWGGLCTHIRDGYNIGQPAYGYKAKTFRHPNSAKAAKGATKSRLEPDGVKAETVTQIAHWRYHERLGYNTIADRLNADHEKYPPPQAPCKRRSRGNWSKSSVRDILFNPKYTGYQVFNRRATTSASGRCNPPEKWIWSPQLTHEPLIPKWMYEEIAKTSSTRRGSRDRALNHHPETKRTYILRGRITCACGRRLRGKFNKGITFYTCQPGANNRGNVDLAAKHPKTVYINESSLLSAITACYSDRLFSSRRKEFLAKDFGDLDTRTVTEHERRTQQLQRKIADIQKRQGNLIRQAETADPSDPFSQGLRHNYNTLEQDLREARAELDALNAETRATGAIPTRHNTTLLDALPVLDVNLSNAPHPLLQRLFEATRLTVTVHPDAEHVDVNITVAPDHLAPVVDTLGPGIRPNTTNSANIPNAPFISTHAGGTPSGVPPASPS